MKRELSYLLQGLGPLKMAYPTDPLAKPARSSGKNAARQPAGCASAPESVQPEVVSGTRTVSRARPGSGLNSGTRHAQHVSPMAVQKNRGVQYPELDGLTPRKLSVDSNSAAAPPGADKYPGPAPLPTATLLDQFDIRQPVLDQKEQHACTGFKSANLGNASESTLLGSGHQVGGVSSSVDVMVEATAANVPAAAGPGSTAAEPEETVEPAQTQGPRGQEKACGGAQRAPVMPVLQLEMEMTDDPSNDMEVKVSSTALAATLPPPPISQQVSANRHSDAAAKPSPVDIRGGETSGTAGREQLGNLSHCDSLLSTESTAELKDIVQQVQYVQSDVHRSTADAHVPSNAAAAGMDESSSNAGDCHAASKPLADGRDISQSTGRATLQDVSHDIQDSRDRPPALTVDQTTCGSGQGPFSFGSPVWDVVQSPIPLAVPMQRAEESKLAQDASIGVPSNLLTSGHSLQARQVRGLDTPAKIAPTHDLSGQPSSTPDDSASEAQSSASQGVPLSQTLPADTAWGMPHSIQASAAGGEIVSPLPGDGCLEQLDEGHAQRRSPMSQSTMQLGAIARSIGKAKTTLGKGPEPSESGLVPRGESGDQALGNVMQDPTAYQQNRAWPAGIRDTPATARSLPLDRPDSVVISSERGCPSPPMPSASLRQPPNKWPNRKQTPPRSSAANSSPEPDNAREMPACSGTAREDELATPALTSGEGYDMGTPHMLLQPHAGFAGMTDTLVGWGAPGNKDDAAPVREDGLVSQGCAGSRQLDLSFTSSMGTAMDRSSLLGCDNAAPRFLYGLDSCIERSGNFIPVSAAFGHHRSEI